MMPLANSIKARASIGSNNSPSGSTPRSIVNTSPRGTQSFFDDALSRTAPQLHGEQKFHVLQTRETTDFCF